MKPAHLATIALLILGGCGQPEPAFTERPLRVAIARTPTLLDPHLQYEVPASQALGNIYDFLVTLDARHRPIPSLAHRWENFEPLGWRFHLRPGIRFHDGRPVEAADVAYSLERARHHPRSTWKGTLVSISALREVDSLTVEVRTAQPSPILLSKLAQICIVPRESPPVIVRPIGSGPFRVIKQQPHFLELAADPGHWRILEGRGRYPRRVELYFESSTTSRVSGLIEGRFDLIEELPLEKIEELNRHPGLRSDSASGLSMNYLQFDLRRPPWNDLRVRQAIELLIDRDRLIREELNGHGVALNQLGNQYVFGFNPTQTTARRDPAQARKLLNEAGYGDGFAMEIEYRAGTSHGTLSRLLSEGGISAVELAQAWPDLYRRFQLGLIGVYRGVWIFDSSDASDLLDQALHSPDPARGLGSLNFTRYSNPLLDRLIEATHDHSDEIERGASLHKAIAMATADRSMIPLFSANVVFGRRRELDWTPRPDGRIFIYELSWRSKEKP